MHISSQQLVDAMQHHTNVNVQYLASHDDIVSYLRSQICEEQLIVTMGAGDISDVAHQLAQVCPSPVR